MDIKEPAQYYIDRMLNIVQEKIDMWDKEYSKTIWFNTDWLYFSFTVSDMPIWETVTLQKENKDD